MFEIISNKNHIPKRVLIPVLSEEVFEKDETAMRHVEECRGGYAMSAALYVKSESEIDRE
jgi:hypothetical protein